MIKNEQYIVTKWVMPWSRKYRKMYPTHVIEAKYMQNRAKLSIDSFEPGQLDRLEKAKDGATFKIVDAGASTYADIASLTGTGFIAAYYENTGLAIIDIDSWDRQPLSWTEAIKIAAHYYRI